MHPTPLQSVLWLGGLSVDARAVLESAAAIAALLYALALRHRRRNLQAWPVAMAGVGLSIDVALPLFRQGLFATLIDSVALILFLWGVIRIGLELADAATHRGREHFSTIFRDLLTLTLWSVVVMVVLRASFRIDVTALIAVPAVLGVVIGFALQETLGNIFSGLTLQISRPFEPGDWVRIADKVGTVHDVGWRATTIVTRANEWLDIPNAQLAKDMLFNYGKHAVAEEVSIGLGYGEPPNRVREVILDVLRDVAEVLSNPEPEILPWDFADYRDPLPRQVLDCGLRAQRTDTCPRCVGPVVRDAPPRDRDSLPHPHAGAQAGKAGGGVRGGTRDRDRTAQRRFSARAQR